jgi:hypothetical protein
MMRESVYAVAIIHEISTAAGKPQSWIVALIVLVIASSMPGV